ncbi:Late embryogenesis abundant protein [Klebsormidium nitens]|uniref:Late embryogenesis abundant protein n=1 Tax=Klebsormidium nitens TaxID=105231 RepID=A0A1Y1IFI3_KLENI|nr:Late embryogenesis abundant protein [Klebsormidium nitens]|eukprot:GAQ89634.1 Late embryogenesis abundant protein [Klebsormidium nitens]
MAAESLSTMQPDAAQVRVEEIEEEPEEPGSTSDDEMDNGAHAECPLCRGSGAVDPGEMESGWQPEEGLFETYPGSESHWDSRFSRRRRHRRRAACLWGRSCQALLISSVYITLALALGFLAVSFYPRNPDFDLVDVRFTKFQLRWERDSTVGMYPSDWANESALDGSIVDSRRQPYVVAEERAQETEEDGRRFLEDADRSIRASESVADTSIRSVLTVAQDLLGWEALNETEKEAWGKALETADENDPTIFGRRLVLDIDLMVKVLVKNPNKVGVHYEASSLDIIYKEKKLGEALLPPGQQAAASSTLIIVPAQLNGLSTFGMSFALLRDWENRAVEMDIAARFTGTVDLIELIPHEFIADMFCDVLTNPRNLKIMKRTCQWKYGGRI